MEKGLLTYLLAQLAGTFGTRIHPVKVPQSTATLPVLVVNRESGVHAHRLSGAAGRAAPSMRLRVFGSTYDSVMTAAEAVRQVMQGFRGEMGTVRVTAVLLDDEFDEYLPAADGSDAGTYARTLDYTIQYRESIPAL